MPWRQGDEHWLLVCEPQNNLVHRELLNHATFPISSRRHPEDSGREFLASTDPWFRPTMARPGLDGALYVVDMYRLVLEHPEWIPAELARGLDLRAGEQRGRVYRVAREGAAAHPAFTDSVTELLSSVRWRRDTAQRLLLESGDKSALPELKKIAHQSKDAGARIQALWTAHLIEDGDATALVSALKAAHPKARGAALVAAGSDDIAPEEWESWFPKAGPSAPTATVPTVANVNPDRQKVVTRYIKEVASLAGDAKRGELVYQKACLACHKLGDLGIELGPELTTVAAKPVEQILEAIFDPNRAVELRNAATQVTKKDGSMVMGLIASETPNHLTLRLAGGVEVIVPKAEIKLTQALTISLMPEGMESLLTPQDCADLLARIRGRH
jgi:putative heme-binding domain-containing protein